MHVSRWGPAGELQYESYSHMKVDAEVADLTALSMPVKDRLCFAGLDCACKCVSQSNNRTLQALALTHPRQTPPAP